VPVGTSMLSETSGVRTKARPRSSMSGAAHRGVLHLDQGAPQPFDGPGYVVSGQVGGAHRLALFESDRVGDDGRKVAGVPDERGDQLPVLASAPYVAAPPRRA
jgi:hypothetical protein